MIFLGSSQVGQDINPNQLWSKNGIASTNCSIDNIDLKYIYYLLKENIKYQNTDLFVIDVLHIYDKEWERKVAYRVLNSLEPSFDRNEIIEQNPYLNTFDQKLDYYFPLFHYHSRTLEERDFRFKFNNINKGYGVKYTRSNLKMPFSDTEDRIALDSSSLFYIDRILDLAKENNKKLLFIKTPYLLANEDRKKSWNAFGDFVKSKGYDFLNFNKATIQKELGYMDSTDFSDKWHLNYWGANKITNYLGRYFIQNYNLKSRKDDVAYKKWQDDYLVYNEGVKRNLLKLNTNFIDYLSDIKKLDDVVVFISSKGIKGNDNKLIKSTLSNYGLKGEVEDKYLSVFSSKGKVYGEKKGLKPIKMNFNGWNNAILDLHNLELISGNVSSSIKINGMEHSQNKEGLNVVMYIPSRKRVFDSFSVDLKDEDLIIKRKKK